MKIFAAFAPSQDVKDRFFSTTPTSIGWALAPLIAAIDKGDLSGAEYIPKIFDPLRVHPGIWSDFEKIMESEQPDVLLISGTYDSHYCAIKLATLAKWKNPHLLVVYGGPHVNEVTSPNVIQAMPQVYPFNESTCPFDILIRGDGEAILLYLMKEYSTLGAKKNLLNYLSKPEARASIALVAGNFEIHAMNGGNLQVIASSGVVLDISKLPLMPRKMFGNDMDLYGFSCFKEKMPDGSMKLQPSTSTMLHRGCKSFCIFCSERGGYRSRRLDHIAMELDQLVQAGIKGVFFDDSTLGDHEGFDELLNCLRGFPLQYGSLNRFDSLQDPYFVKKLADCGFVYQYCSIEQFDRSVLKMAAKGQKVEAIRRGAENLMASGIQLGTSLLFGLPGESEESIKATLNYVAEIDSLGLLSCVSMSLYSYHPNTPLTLGTPEGRQMHALLRYDGEPPNRGEPWNAFEEGQWYHPPWVTPDRVEYIYQAAQDSIGHRLVRNMRKDGEEQI